MHSLLVTIAVLVLSGCAATSSERAYQALRANNLAAAEKLYFEALNDGDEGAWHNLGVIYDRQGQRAKAVQFLIMGARYGDQNAQRGLLQLGQPVPVADLKGRSTSDGGATAAAIILGGMAAGAQTRPPIQPAVRCETRRRAWGNETVCR